MFENPNDTQEFYNLHFSPSFTGYLNMSYQLMWVFPHSDTDCWKSHALSYFYHSFSVQYIKSFIVRGYSLSPKYLY